MNIGYFNARGPNNGVEHWFDLEIKELRKRGHDVRVFWLRGDQPTRTDIKWMDIAHFHFAQVADYYKRIGIPFILSPHANDIWVDSGATLSRASKHPKCRFVTHQSFYHKRKFIEWDISKPLVYLPMCCRTDLFKRARQSTEDSGILAGGRLIPKKGLDKIIHLDDLVIFGDGPLEQSLRDKNSKVKFTGWLDGPQLRDVMEDSWLFLNPSVVTSDGDKEGIPNTIKEAMLMQLQVISTPVAGIPELENIFLLDDWSNIEEFIGTIPREPNWKGMKEIQGIYSPESCVNRIEKAIEEYI